MPETDKQQRIRRLYVQFSELCAEISSLKYEILEDTSYDPPDVDVDNHKLGIEFVDFVHGWGGAGGSPVRAAEVIFDRIVTEAQQRFEQKKDVKVRACFYWLDHTRPKQSDISKLSQAIVGLISDVLSIRKQQTFEIEYDDFAETCLVDYLHSINIQRLPDMVSEHWESSQRGWTGFGAESFQMLTNEKEKDLPRYSYDFESLWLVIVADSSAASSIVIPDQTIKPGCVMSEFDRVYFFDTLSKRIISLTSEESSYGPA